MKNNHIIGTVLIALIFGCIGALLWVSKEISENSSDKTVMLSEKAKSTDLEVDYEPLPEYKMPIEEVHNNLTLAVIFLSITTLISIIISFYLYRWRKILLSKPHTHLPEDTGKFLSGLDDGYKQILEFLKNDWHLMRKNLSNNEKRIETELNEQTKKIKVLEEMFLKLQGSLNDKDNEIERLKEGYDNKIYRKYLLRFIRVNQAIDDSIDDVNIDKSTLISIKELLMDALSECEVESFSPNVGEKYHKAFGVADNPKEVPPDSPNDENKIAEIVEHGYKMKTPSGYEVVLPAKVKIYSQYTGE